VREQIEFLQASSGAYDSGNEGEAKRLAATIRVLLHDTGKSVSLLTQLGLKDKIAYTDTAVPIQPENLMNTVGLAMMRTTVGVGGSYVPPLGELAPPRLKPPVLFDDWWMSPVTKVRDTTWSRRDYVLTVANKEGGSHVDPALDDQWRELTTHNALGWMYFDEITGEKPFDRDPALASVRQIAYKLERTLDDQLLVEKATSRDDLLNPDRAILTPRGLGRNDPCPCGSGKEFKRCHGR
jgi:hypothetical protein